jgi:pilus assembly protein Flp/PilA
MCRCVFFMLCSYGRASIISSIVIEYISEFVTDIYEQISAIYLGLRDAGPYRFQSHGEDLSSRRSGLRESDQKTGSIVMKTFFARFAQDESGATAIEYGLIAALIGVAIVSAAGAVGDSLNTLFTDVKTELDKR